MNAAVLLTVFVFPLAVGAGVGWWQWFIPRWRLNRIFKQCRRARLLKAAFEQAAA